MFSRTCGYLPAGPVFLPPRRHSQSLPWGCFRILQGVFFRLRQMIISPADQRICRPRFGKG